MIKITKQINAIKKAINATPTKRVNAKDLQKIASKLSTEAQEKQAEIVRSLEAKGINAKAFLENMSKKIKK